MKTNNASGSPDELENFLDKVITERIRNCIFQAFEKKQLNSKTLSNLLYFDIILHESSIYKKLESVAAERIATYEQECNFQHPAEGFKRILYRYLGSRYDLAYVAKHLIASSLIRVPVLQIDQSERDLFDEESVAYCDQQYLFELDPFGCPSQLIEFFEFCRSTSESSSLDVNIFSALLLAYNYDKMFNEISALLFQLGL